MNLRVFAGEFKGRTIKTPKTQHLRPTIGKIRQAIFNICQNRVQNAYFLDLFAGSGAMGIEALSQGASFAAFVENHHNQAQMIQENLHALELDNKALIIQKDIFVALDLLQHTFDIVYIDPPYHECSKETLATIVNTLDKNLLLKTESIIFIEVPDLLALNLNPNIFYLFAVRKFGRSSLLEYHYLQ